jgi:hypothetical protein
LRCGGGVSADETNVFGASRAATIAPLTYLGFQSQILTSFTPTDSTGARAASPAARPFALHKDDHGHD